MMSGCKECRHGPLARYGSPSIQGAGPPFKAALIKLLARYHGLGGSGFQYALNEKAFEVLGTHHRAGLPMPVAPLCLRLDALNMQPQLIGCAAAGAAPPAGGRHGVLCQPAQLPIRAFLLGVW